jgi:quinol monooxygenase YgiN
LDRHDVAARVEGLSHLRRTTEAGMSWKGQLSGGAGHGPLHGPKRQQEEETIREDIYWVSVFKLEPSRLDDFKKVVRPLVDMTRNEEGSMAYEYHVSADHTEIHIIEHYRSSADVVHHVTKTFSQFAEPFTAIASVSSFIVYGTPDAAAKEILDGFGAVYLTNFDGFTK